MSRIKLRDLLYLTEQAPQPPVEDPSLDPMMADVPADPSAGGLPQAPGAIPGGASPQPPAGMNAGGLPQPPEATPTPDTTTPGPEDPGEYDFTKDFREFEDKKNKAEADAKKSLLEKMNEKLLGKTIVANASRGYGQPKTDYTIKAVKKISVEFWYKDYVVIATDENDKKYFLTTGINIKIENEGSVDQPTAGEPKGQETGGQPAAPEEAPNGQPPEGEEPAPEAQGVQPEVPTEQPAPQPAPTAPAPVDPKKKKKLPPQQPVAENNGNEKVSSDTAQQDLGKFFSYWLNTRFDVRPYVKRAITSGKDNDGTYHTEYVLEIPKQVFSNNFDGRDFALEFRNEEYSSGGPGQPFSRGSVNVISNGKFYTFKFSLSGGMDI